MATEYTFESDCAMSASEVLPFLAAVLGAEVVDGRYLRREAMHIIPAAVEPEDAPTTTEALGFTPRLSVTFRLLGEGTEATRNSSLAAMVGGVLALLAECSGDGVLLLNFERIVLQRLGGTIAVDDTWGYWAELPQLAALVGNYERRTLDQPFL